MTGDKNKGRETATFPYVLFLLAFLSLLLAQGPWWAAEDNLQSDGSNVITHAVPGKTLLEFIPKEINVTWRSLLPECEGQHLTTTLGEKQAYSRDAVEKQRAIEKLDQAAPNPQASVAIRGDYWFTKHVEDTRVADCSARLYDPKAPARQYIGPVITIIDFASKKSCEQVVRNIDVYRYRESYYHRQLNPEAYCDDVRDLVQKIEGRRNFEEIMIGRHIAYYTMEREIDHSRGSVEDVGVAGLKIPVADRFWVQITGGELSREQFLEIASQIDLDDLEKLQHSGETRMDGSDNTGGWLGGTVEWGREQINDIGYVLEGIYRWLLKLVNPNYCQTNADCPQYSTCNQVTSTCCTDAHCCENGTTWSNEVNMCIYAVGIPADTPCTAGWPNRQGPVIPAGVINEENRACDLFEVTDPGLLVIANQTLTCYQNNCTGDCHANCSQAMRDSGADNVKDAKHFKAFAAYYLIYSLGPAAQHMQGYFDPEINCGAGSGVCAPLAGFGANTRQLVCRGPVGQPLGWANDTNMANNSCIFSDLPAHADISILQTGTCADYSISLTTLLRMVGYSRDEVYSVGAPGHEYNLVRFPDDSNWTIADTVGNADAPLGDTWHWGPGNRTTHCDYDRDTCVNDAGVTTCPAITEVGGC